MVNIREEISLLGGLENLSNLELYYLVSKSFGLGGYGNSFIEKEKLFVNFKFETSIRFVFISTLPIICEVQTEPKTSFFLGEITEGFETIKVFEVQVPWKLIDENFQLLLKATDLTTLLKEPQQVFLNPLELVEGLLHVAHRTDTKTRVVNPTSYILEDQDQLNHNKVEITLPEIYGLDFSGSYSLVAEPINPWKNFSDAAGTLIHEYFECEDDSFTVVSKKLDIENMDRFEVNSINEKVIINI